MAGSATGAPPPRLPGRRPPGDAAAEALERAGLLRPADRARAREVLSGFLQPTAFPFEADSVFLSACVAHHVGAYLRQVMEPAALSHLANSRLVGRLISDADVERGTVGVVELVAGELSPQYAEHMYRYFGGEEGLAGYLYSRVRALLIEEALRHNEAFLARITRQRGAEEARALLRRDDPLDGGGAAPALRPA